jgi:hypothetical protein
VGIRKLKQAEVKVLELEETMENLARQLKEANTKKDILLDETRKGTKSWKHMKGKSRNYKLHRKMKGPNLNNKSLCSTGTWKNMPSV